MLRAPKPLGLVYKEKAQQAKYYAKLVPEGTRLLGHLVLYISKNGSKLTITPNLSLREQQNG